MLLNHSSFASETTTGLATVHNYYEKLVVESLMNMSERAEEDSDFLADVCCVALNHLPPRYIRHDVDMTFFMSPVELYETTEKVREAVSDAINYVLSREKEKSQSDNTESDGDDDNNAEVDS